jgi:hypothetical protein
VSGILLFFVALFILFFCYFDKNVKFSFKVLATERERERERESSLFTLWEFDNARFNFIVIFRIIIS